MGVILPNLFAVMIAHNGDIDLTLQYNGMGQGYRKPKRILKKSTVPAISGPGSSVQEHLHDVFWHNEFCCDSWQQQNGHLIITIVCFQSSQIRTSPR